MTINLRWQLLLAIVGLGLVLALLSFQVQSAGFCSVRVPATGGVFIEGIVGAPQSLNPLLQDGFPVDQELVDLLFDGLTRYDADGVLTPVLAESWSVSDDGLSVTFRLRDDAFWHDGQRVTVADVLFTFGLLQDEAFPGSPALAQLWQEVTISEVAEDEWAVRFTLPTPYSPFLEATTQPLLPAHLLADVPVADLATADFNLAPVGTGPFQVDGSVNWRENGRLRLVPNPLDWRGGIQIAAIEFHFFPDEERLLEAFLAGNVQAINRVNQTTMPTVAAIPDIRLFSAPLPTYSALWFNLRETAVALTRSASGRQALAAALNREELVSVAMNGQGLVFDGPYVPGNWAYNPGIFAARAFDPGTAVTLLETAGWTLGEGQTVRQREGQPLRLRLIALDTPTAQAVSDTIATPWAEVGVATEITLVTDGAELRQLLADGAYDVALLSFTPPGDPDLYDFWSQEAIVRGQNFTGWNSRRASEALEQGRQIWGMAERRPLYDTFLRFFDQDLPAFTLYQDVYTYALSPAVHQAEIGLISRPRDRYKTLADWFLLFRDVTVACPPEELPAN